jgi:hypothetical protein
MSDVSWGSDHLEPAKKSKIPGWVLGCAGGCMFLIGAAGVAVYFGGQMVERWLAKNADPDVQWPRLAEVLPHDERPEGVEIMRWPIPLVDVWQLESKGEDVVAFVAAAGDTGGSGPSSGMGEVLRQWFEKPEELPMLAMQRAEFETQAGKLSIQGRELNVVRIHRKRDSSEARPGESAPDPLTPPNPPRELDAPSPPGETLVPVPPDAPASSGESTEPPGAEEDGQQALERTAEMMDNENILGDGLAIDVSPEVAPGGAPERGRRRVVIWILRRQAGGTLADEDVARLLAPFHIGSVR